MILNFVPVLEKMSNLAKIFKNKLADMLSREGDLPLKFKCKGLAPHCGARKCTSLGSRAWQVFNGNAF